MIISHNTFENLKKFEHLFQNGHKSVLIDTTIKKLAEIELFGLKKEFQEVKFRIDGFEKQYNMTTKSFLKKFNSGEIEDDADFIEWFAYSDMGTALRKKIDILEMKTMCRPQNL